MIQFEKDSTVVSEAEEGQYSEQKTCVRETAYNLFGEITDGEKKRADVRNNGTGVSAVRENTSNSSRQR